MLESILIQKIMQIHAHRLMKMVGLGMTKIHYLLSSESGLQVPLLKIFGSGDDLRTDEKLPGKLPVSMGKKYHGREKATKYLGLLASTF